MLVPVILSGGAGARLWPVSREAFPKPFIRLPDGKSLLQRTLIRAARVNGVSHVITVTNREYYFLTKDEYSAVSGLSHVFLLEPEARNTAPAIAMAAFHVARPPWRGYRTLVLPADHLIEDLESFASAVEIARGLARGISRYLWRPADLPGDGLWLHRVFGGDSRTRQLQGGPLHRKTALDKAERFIATRQFLWNSGMFCFQAGAFLDALRRVSASLYERRRRAGTRPLLCPRTRSVSMPSALPLCPIFPSTMQLWRNTRT